MALAADALNAGAFGCGPMKGKIDRPNVLQVINSGYVADELLVRPAEIRL